jgi:hypothetical protein
VGVAVVTLLAALAAAAAGTRLEFEPAER